MPEELRRYLRPREGWISWFLLFVMLLTLAWAVQRAEWLKQAEFLGPVAFYAALLGALLGLSRLSVLVTLPISAVVGAATVLWTVGGEYFPELGQVDRLLVLRTDAVDWTRVVVKLGYPPELTPYAIGLALVMWVTAFIAAYTLYRHHRALDAILLVGAALVANMSATYTDLFFYLVLFVLAGLLLWLRVALLNREDGWRRRRVTETADVPSAIMRTGLVFIATSIVLSWLLTSVAVGAPLTGAWRNLDSIYTSARDQFQGLFQNLGNSNARFQGPSFGSSFTVLGSWSGSDRTVLTVGEKSAYYLETIAYDSYTGTGWTRSATKARAVDANKAVFPPTTPDAPIYDPKTVVTEEVTVVFNNPPGRNLFTPGFPLRLDSPAVVQEPAGQPLFAGLDAKGAVSPGSGYHLTAAISKATIAQLVGAGNDYPALIKQFYLDTTGITSRTKALAQDLVTQAGATDAYHKAITLADWLRTDRSFTYSQTAPVPPRGRDLVDFFLFDTKNGRKGYCQYYASAMVMMARSLGLPARLAAGYAPGSIVQPGTPDYHPDTFTYREKNSHVWAEIYFPGYGWQIFEATHSISPPGRQTGVAGPSQGPLPTPGIGERNNFPEGAEQQTVLPSVPPIVSSPGGTLDTGATRIGNLVVVALILFAVAAVIFWRLRLVQRRMRFLPPGDRQWRLLLLAADRAGVRQRPSETDFEYAGWLEDQIPARRPEIRAIAEGKVWGSYSGRGMTADVVSKMESAWRRLRMPFISLAVRRRLRALLPHRASS